MQPIQELECFYDLMFPAKQNDEEAFVWITGYRHPLFNCVTHLNSVEKVDQIISEGVPISFWLHEQNKADLAGVLESKGFQPAFTCTMMNWDVKPLASGNHRIELADSETFQQILDSAFHLDSVVREGNARLLENAKAENYLVYRDNKPVGTGTLICKGKIGGIFMIATLPDHQKKGCGRSMMLHLMNRAAKLGLKKLVLLSSPMGVKLYSDLGFTKCYEVKLYTQKE